MTVTCKTRFIFAALLTLSLWTASPGTAVAAPAAEQVDAAIRRMRQFLYRLQDAQAGSWETRRRQDTEHFGHTTALVTMALLESGDSFQNPRLVPTLAFLQQLRGGDAYTVYPRALCWSLLPDAFRGNLEADMAHLAKLQQNGLFHHQNRQSGRADHRATLYGLMAMHAGTERGVAVSAKLWEQAADHLVRAQRRDGGWSFTDQKDEASTVPATVNCLTALHLCRYHLAHSASAVESIGQSLLRGERYLYRNFELKPFVSSSGKAYSFEAAFHDLYLLERMTRYSGIRVLGEQDWFEQALTTILEQEAGRGSIRGDRVETAFALVVLSQARASVWINKLKLSGARWDNRPGDLYRLTRQLSERREADLHWQVVSIDDPLLLWLTAPIVYLSTDEPVQFTNEQKARLKRYLDLGGLLIANPEGGNAEVRRSFESLARELYPHGTLAPVSEGHAAVSLLHSVPSGGMLSLSNGVRDLMLLPQRDLKLGEGGDQAEVVSLFWNLYAWTSERGQTTPRLYSPVAVASEVTPVRRIRVGVVTVEGKPFAEPLAWQVFAQWLLQRDGVEVTVEPVALGQISAEATPFVHWADVQGGDLTDSQCAAIERYVNQGGTLFVETLSGLGDFTGHVQRQLEGRLGDRAERLPAGYFREWSEPGSRAAASGQRAVFRPFSVYQFGVGNRHRLHALKVKGRSAIVFSDADITLGLLGVRRWGIYGYRPDAARQIMRHILSSADIKPPANSDDPSQSSLVDRR